MDQPVADATQPQTSMVTAMALRALHRSINTAPGMPSSSIAGEENSRAETEDGVGKMQLRGHLQTREADVDAVDIGDDVEQEKKRHQPPRNAAKVR